MIDKNHKTDSPFHRIRRQDAIGEYWSAEEIAHEIGYGREQFMETILAQAITQCRELMDRGTADRHFRDSIGPGEEGNEYRLSFYLCVLIAKISDPALPGTSEAKAYFRPINPFKNRKSADHTAATEKARQFVQERCRIEDGLSVGSREIGEAWRKWCVNHGVEIGPGSQGIRYHLRRIIGNFPVETPKNQRGMKVSTYHGIGLRD